MNPELKPPVPPAIACAPAEDDIAKAMRLKPVRCRAPFIPRISSFVMLGSTRQCALRCSSDIETIVHSCFAFMINRLHRNRWGWRQLLRFDFSLVDRQLY